MAFTTVLELFNGEITFHTENWQHKAIYMLAFLPAQQRVI